MTTQPQIIAKRTLEWFMNSDRDDSEMMTKALGDALRLIIALQRDVCALSQQVNELERRMERKS